MFTVVCVVVVACVVVVVTCVYQRTTCRNWLSPSTMWIPGVHFRLSGLAAILVACLRVF